MSASHGFFNFDFDSLPQCPACSAPVFTVDAEFCFNCDRQLSSVEHNLRETTRDKVVQDMRVDSNPGVLDDEEDGDWSYSNQRNGFGVDEDDGMVGDESPSMRKSPSVVEPKRKKSKKSADDKVKAVPTNAWRKVPVWKKRKDGTVGNRPFQKFDGSEPELDPTRPENVKAIADLEEKHGFSDDYDPTTLLDEDMDKEEMIELTVAYMKYLMCKKGYKVGLKPNGGIRGDGAAYKYSTYTRRLFGTDWFNTAADFVSERRRWALCITRAYAEETAPGTSHKGRKFEEANDKQKEAHIVKLQNNEMHGFDDFSKVFGEKLEEWEARMSEENAEEGEEEEEEDAPSTPSASYVQDVALPGVRDTAPKRKPSFCNPSDGKKPRLALSDEEEEYEYEEEE
jgi:hypothetical protein